MEFQKGLCLINPIWSYDSTDRKLILTKLYSCVLTVVQTVGSTHFEEAVYWLVCCMLLSTVHSEQHCQHAPQLCGWLSSQQHSMCMYEMLKMKCRGQRAHIQEGDMSDVHPAPSTCMTGLGLKYFGLMIIYLWWVTTNKWNQWAHLGKFLC